MSHSKTTKNYKLPLFEPTDRPAWLTDFNGAMQTVDSTLKEFEGGIAGGGLPISGGTMQGAIDMGGNAITEVQEVELPESGDGLYVGSVIQPAGTGGARITGVTGGGAAVVKADTQSTYTQLKVGSPSADNDAATKAYVDANKGMTQAAADSRYLKLAGGTLTGPLTLSGSPTSDLQAATKGYVDSHSGGTKTLIDSFTISFDNSVAKSYPTLNIEKPVYIKAFNDAGVSATGGSDSGGCWVVCGSNSTGAVYSSTNGIWGLTWASNASVSTSGVHHCCSMFIPAGGGGRYGQSWSNYWLAPLASEWGARPVDFIQGVTFKFVGKYYGSVTATVHVEIYQ